MAHFFVRIKKVNKENKNNILKNRRNDNLGKSVLFGLEATGSLYLIVAHRNNLPDYGPPEIKKNQIIFHQRIYGGKKMLIKTF